MIIYDISWHSVMFQMLFLRSFLHPVLSNLTCKKQWLISVLLKTLLKLWRLVLNYNFPNKWGFTIYKALFVLFLNFLLPVKSSQCIESAGCEILSQKVVFFLQIYVFYRRRKTTQVDFPEKQAPIKVWHLLPVCQISRNFTVDVKKYVKNTDIFRQGCTDK